MSVEIRQDFFTYGEVSKAMQAAPTSDSYQRALALCKNAITRPEGGVTNRAGTRFVKDLTSFSTLENISESDQGAETPDTNPDGIRIFPTFGDGAQEIIYFWLGDARLKVYAAIPRDDGTCDIFKVSFTGEETFDPDIYDYTTIDHVAVEEGFQSDKINVFPYRGSICFAATQNCFLVVTPRYDDTDGHIVGLRGEVYSAKPFDFDFEDDVAAFSPAPSVAITSTIEAGKENGVPIAFVVTLYDRLTKSEQLWSTHLIDSDDVPREYSISNYLTITASDLTASKYFRVYISKTGDITTATFLGTIKGNGAGSALLYIGQSSEGSISYPSAAELTTGFAMDAGYRASATEIFQQRLVLGGFGGETNGSSSDPGLSRVSFSELQRIDRFTRKAQLLKESDSFGIDLDDAGQVYHFLSHKRFLCFTAAGVYSFYGEDEGAMSPSSIIPGSPNKYVADPRTRPIVGAGNVYFVSGPPVRLIKCQYVREFNGYEFLEISMQSADLVRRGSRVRRLAYNESLFNTLWMAHERTATAPVSRDVTGASFIPHTNTVGFHRHDFGGEVVDIASTSLPNGGVKTYMVVRRWSPEDEEFKYYLEFMLNREIIEAAGAIDEDAFSEFMDSSVTSVADRYTHATSVGTLSQSDGWGAGEEIAWVAAEMLSSAFDPVDGIRFVGDIYVDGELTHVEWSGVVASTSDAQNYVITSDEDVPAILRGAIPQGVEVVYLRKVISGLSHLNGCNVSVKADGMTVASPYNDTYATVTVDGGQIVLEDWADSVTVGLPYVSDVKLMPYVNLRDPDDINSRRSALSVDVNLQKTKGLRAAGSTPSDDTTVIGFQKINELNNEFSNDFLDGEFNIPIAGGWDQYGQVFFRQVDPEPFTILSVAVQHEE